MKRPWKVLRNRFFLFFWRKMVLGILEICSIMREWFSIITGNTSLPYRHIWLGYGWQPEPQHPSHQWWRSHPWADWVEGCWCVLPSPDSVPAPSGCGRQRWRGERPSPGTDAPLHVCPGEWVSEDTNTWLPDRIRLQINMKNTNNFKRFSYFFLHIFAVQGNPVY